MLSNAPRSPATCALAHTADLTSRCAALCVTPPPTRSWAYETFGSDRVLEFVVMATPGE